MGASCIFQSTFMRYPTYAFKYASADEPPIKCQGPRPCYRTVIKPGELMFCMDLNKHLWRHWGCTGRGRFLKMQKGSYNIERVTGFDTLTAEDQQKARTAYEVGHVAEEDKPESARVDPGEQDSVKSKGKGKAATKKRKAKDTHDEPDTADPEDEQVESSRKRKKSDEGDTAEH